MHWVMHCHFSAHGLCYCSLWRRIYSYLFVSIFQRAYLFVSVRIYTYLFVSIHIYFRCLFIFIDTRIYSYLFWGVRIYSYLSVSIFQKIDTPYLFSSARRLKNTAAACLNKVKRLSDCCSAAACLNTRSNFRCSGNTWNCDAPPPGETEFWRREDLKFTGPVEQELATYEYDVWL